MFAHNFVAVLPAELIDPVIKLRLRVASDSGLPADAFYIQLGYDPQIEPDRLLVPPPEELRARRLASSVLADIADRPIVFESEDYRDLVRISARWEEDGEAIRFHITSDLYGLRLLAAIIAREQIPVISDHGAELLLYAIRASLGLQRVRTYDFSAAKFAHIKRREVCIERSLAVDFFGLDPNILESCGSNSLLLAAAEVR